MAINSHTDLFSSAACLCLQQESMSVNALSRVLEAVAKSRFLRLSLPTMSNPNQLCGVLSFVCSEMADETNLSSKLPVADRIREV